MSLYCEFTLYVGHMAYVIAYVFLLYMESRIGRYLKSASRGDLVVATWRYEACVYTAICVLLVLCELDRLVMAKRRGGFGITVGRF